MDEQREAVTATNVQRKTEQLSRKRQVQQLTQEWRETVARTQQLQARWPPRRGLGWGGRAAAALDTDTLSIHHAYTLTLLAVPLACACAPGWQLACHQLEQEIKRLRPAAPAAVAAAAAAQAPSQQ